MSYFVSKYKYEIVTSDVLLMLPELVQGMFSSKTDSYHFLCISNYRYLHQDITTNQFDMRIVDKKTGKRKGVKVAPEVKAHNKKLKDYDPIIRNAKKDDGEDETLFFLSQQLLPKKNLKSSMKHNSEILEDRFGRKHNYLRISLTERCNLRCFYCMPEEGVPLREKQEFMTAEETIYIAKKFVQHGVDKIRLTGGEPLIKKGFEFLIKELSQLPVEIGITTNAVILDRYIELLKSTGVRKLNISLDSLQEDRMNKISRRGYFKRIMNNIEMAIAEDFEVKINVVLIRGVNDDEIIDFVEWTKTRKVSLRFIEFMPFDGNNWDSEKKVSSKEIIDVLSKHYGKTEVLRIEDAKNDTTRNYRISGFTGSFGVISSVTNPFCSTCNRIRLTADGKLKNCLFSRSETDLLSALRKGEDIAPLMLGNILEKSKERGGYKTFDNKTAGKMKNRNMTTIGG